MIGQARRLVVLLGLTMLTFAVCASAVHARTVTDSVGRRVEVPDYITRVFAAGPPAGIFLYVVAPEKMIGWGARHATSTSRSCCRRCAILRSSAG